MGYETKYYYNIIVRVSLSFLIIKCGYEMENNNLAYLVKGSPRVYVQGGYSHFLLVKKVPKIIPVPSPAGGQTFCVPHFDNIIKPPKINSF